MMRMKLIVEHFSKELRLLEKRERWSRSWVKQFVVFLYCYADFTAFNITDIGNTARDINIGSSYSMDSLRIGGPPGGSQLKHEKIQDLDGENIGIQIGSGTTAPTPTDYKMETRIPHGEASGKMLYGGTGLYGLTISNPNGQFTISRYFTNASGGSIDVNEVGIQCVGGIASDTGSELYAFLIARDTIVTVSVANGELLRVTYVPQITV